MESTYEPKTSAAPLLPPLEDEPAICSQQLGQSGTREMEMEGGQPHKPYVPNIFLHSYHDIDQASPS